MIHKNTYLIGNGDFGVKKSKPEIIYEFAMLMLALISVSFIWVDDY
jgi:hypothetical protein